ncbi:hypothetical protein M422DRAFT_37719 [Sphaerobolus stellatus SS14]|uniref:Uncharacterized protein n=1 Tax=Sphaerobolus stellatus (strain SS14) TaxID=990650 RepID=A0A0C9UQB1_SPHS4|nr:hypothetical protein M422DRAFT_37719 [Sphaerobolus stellatus SS14]
MPPFPSHHHCPICTKKTKSQARVGHCKKHQWVCNAGNHKWVQLWTENCEICQNPPPDSCVVCNAVNPNET